MEILIKCIIVTDPGHPGKPLRDVKAVGPASSWEEALWKDMFFKCRNCPPETVVLVNNCPGDGKTVTAGEIRDMTCIGELWDRFGTWFLPKKGELPEFSVQFLEEGVTTDIVFAKV